MLPSAARGCGSGRFVDVAGDSAAPSFGVATRRIKVKLDRSGLHRVSDLVGFFFCPSLGFFVGGGLAKVLGMLVYQLGSPGWLLDLIYSGGLHLLFGSLDAVRGVCPLLHR